MNFRMMLRFLCNILAVLAIFMLPAFIYALCIGERAASLGFGVSLLFIAAGSLLPRLVPVYKRNITAKEGFVLVAVAWIFVSVFGCLPFLISGAIPSPIDAFFETVSGFTTTGSSILNDVEALPRSLLLWRSMTHWLGGMGVLVFYLAIVQLGKSEGYSIFILRAESPGPEVTKLVPRTRRTALILYGIYIVLTLLLFLFLLPAVPTFDAVTTALGTAGTGGFGIKATSLMEYSPYVQNVVAIFMALFGINFSLYYLLLIRSFSRALKNEELRCYLFIMGAATLAITINTLPMYGGIFEALRYAFFQVSSVMTSTGFATADFNLWPQFSKTILFLLMFGGACAGSTGGGMKISRLVILIKDAKNMLLRTLRPNTVRLVHMDQGIVDRDTVQSTQLFFLLYMVISACSLLLLSLDNASLETNVSAVITCMSNIGPGFDLVGPMGNFSGFSTLSKLVLSLDMLFGRLEIFPMLLMLTLPLSKLPRWRRQKSM